METKIDSMASDVKDIKKSIESLPDRFVPRKEFDEFKSDMCTKEKTLKDRVWDFSKLVIGPAIAIILGIVLSNYV